MTELCICVQVVYGHLDDPHHQEIIRGKSYLQLRPGTPCVDTVHASMTGCVLLHVDAQLLRDLAERTVELKESSVATW